MPKFNETFTTPTILGGAFAATKKFFQEIDYYGKGMKGWGGENYEIGIKVNLKQFLTLKALNSNLNTSKLPLDMVLWRKSIDYTVLKSFTLRCSTRPTFTR